MPLLRLLIALALCALLAGCQTTEVRPTPGIPTFAPTTKPAATPPAASRTGPPVVSVASPVALSPDVVVTANRQGHSLSIVDPAAGRVVGTVALDRPAHGVAISADQRFAYATDPSESSRSVAVADLTQARQVGTVAVGLQPDGIAAGSGGQVVVANSGDSTVTFFDAATHTPSAPIAVGDTPRGVGIVVVAGQVSAFVANEGDNSVSILHLGQSQTAVEVGASPIAVAPSPDGTRVYVLESAGGDVATIDVLSNQVLDRVHVGSRLTGLDTTADGTSLLVTADDATHGMYRVDLATNQVAESFNLAVGALAVAASPHGDRAYITTSDNRLLIWDLAGRRIANALPVGQRPEGVAVRAQPLPSPASSPSPLPIPGISPRPAQAGTPAPTVSLPPGPVVNPFASPAASPSATGAP